MWGFSVPFSINASPIRSGITLCNCAVSSMPVFGVESTSGLCDTANSRVWLMPWRDVCALIPNKSVVSGGIRIKLERLLGRGFSSLSSWDGEIDGGRCAVVVLGIALETERCPEWKEHRASTAADGDSDARSGLEDGSCVAIYTVYIVLLK